MLDMLNLPHLHAESHLVYAFCVGWVQGIGGEGAGLANDASACLHDVHSMHLMYCLKRTMVLLDLLVVTGSAAVVFLEVLCN